RRRSVDDLAAIGNHRHPDGIGLRQLLLLSEPPRHGLDTEALVGERHLGAPTERAEPPLRVSAGEIIKGDGHHLLRRGFGREKSYRSLSSSNPILVTHLADLAIGEVDLEQIFRGADHTDRGMSADIEDFGTV